MGPWALAWRHPSPWRSCGRSLAAAAGQRHAHTASSLEELNQELHNMFTVAGTSSDSAAGAAPAGGGAAPSAEPPATAVLEEQAAALNQELFDFFGVSQSSQQGSEQQQQSAASVLSQHIAGVVAGTQPHHSNAGSVPPLFQQQQQHQQRPLQQTQQPQRQDSSSLSGVGEAPGLTHVDATGRATMVDVGQKADTRRTATAAARVLLGPAVYALVAGNQLAKGDVLTVAQLAGVMGAKHTATLIPLCHNIALSKVHVALELAPADHAVEVRATASAVGPTGVEMEALTAAAVAALTVYDMCKAASKGVVISNLRLLSKSGGKSGDWEEAGQDHLTP